jgi:hypothetical protein
MTVADDTVTEDDDTQDWVADCDGEGQERAVRDGRDSRVVMMAVVVEDGGGGQQRRRWTTITAENNGLQDWVAGYNGEGQERVVRKGQDSIVAMMAAGAEDGGGKQQWQQWKTTVTADYDSGRQKRRQMMMAGEIKWRTKRGKEESGWQTTTALGPPGREHEKVKKLGLCKKTFFSDTVCLVGVLAPAQNQLVSF